MSIEKTLLLIKPDAVQRNIIGKILLRYEEKGLKIAAMKMIIMTRQQAEELYKPHVGKYFFEETVEFMTSAPLVAVIIEGDDAIDHVRKLNGATNPLEAACGTVRGDYARITSRNCVHGSDCAESARREMSIFFTKEEIVAYDKALTPWVGEDGRRSQAGALRT